MTTYFDISRCRFHHRGDLEGVRVSSRKRYHLDEIAMHALNVQHRQQEA